ncbi:MAG: rod shape-determining protein MreC [Planctomycetota bacterium]
MSKRGGNPTAPQIAIFAIAVLVSFAPLKVTGWMSLFRDPLLTVIAPVSGPVSILATRLRGDEDRNESELGELTRTELEELYLEEQRGRLEALGRIMALEAIIRDLQGGVEGFSALPIRRMVAPVIGSTPPAKITVRRGTADGVYALSTVAVASGTHQIVGVVSDVERRLSTVHLLTDKQMPWGLIEGVVVDAGGVTREALESAPRLQLRAVGNGTLVAEQVVQETAEQISVGQLVRVRDGTVSDAAQMLVLGEVRQVEETDDPQHRLVLVRPLVDDLSRVGTAVLYMPVVDRDAEVEP